MPTPPADGSDEDCRPAEERDAVSVDEESLTVRDACSGMDADAEASTRAGRAVDSMMLTGAVGLTAGPVFSDVAPVAGVVGATTCDAVGVAAEPFETFVGER